MTRICVSVSHYIVLSFHQRVITLELTAKRTKGPNPNGAFAGFSGSTPSPLMSIKRKGSATPVLIMARKALVLDVWFILFTSSKLYNRDFVGVMDAVLYSVSGRYVIKRTGQTDQIQALAPLSSCKTSSG